jgi:hypothetical protein
MTALAKAIEVKCFFKLFIAYTSPTLQTSPNANYTPSAFTRFPVIASLYWAVINKFIILTTRAPLNIKSILVMKVW